MQRAARRLAAALLGLGLLAGAGTAADVDPGAALGAAVTAYDPARPAEGKAQAADAFFLFESSKLDRDLAVRDPALYRRTEDEWMRLIAEMDDGAPADAVRQRANRVLALLDSGARSAAGGSVFLDAALIILREGFEAILIVSALAAYLRRVGERAKAPYLYGGAAVAVLASLALWAAAASVIAVSGPEREALEGATMLFAAVVLFWVSYWLVSKAEADRWQRFVRRKAEQAIGRGALLGFGLVSFVVVFREGFETVLFYEALAARAPDTSGQTLLAAGFLSGAATLAVLWGLFARVGHRIPIGAFFGVTGGLLYFMAFKFAGGGVRELQEAGWVSRTPLSFVPDSPALGQWLGIYPYAESSIAQGLLLGLVVFALVHTLRARGAGVEPAPASARRAVG